MKGNLLKLAEGRILVEQLRLILSNVKDTVFIVLAYFIFMAWFYSDENNRFAIGVWFITITLFRLLIVFYVRSLIASGINVAQVHRVAWRFIVLQGIDGIIMGSLVFLIIIDEAHMLESMMLVVILIGVILIILAQYSSVFLIFLAKATPIVLPLTIKLLLMDHTSYQALGIAGILLSMMILIQAKVYYFTTLSSIELRFENTQLLEKLRTETEHAQALLLKAELAQLEAEQANTSKSKFLAAASHDLRQPLHALSLFTSVLDEVIRYPKVRTVVKQINASVDSLQNLFNALLDISQLDAGVMKVEKTNFYIQPLFNKLANDFDEQATRKGLRIIWQSNSFSVHSDPVLFEQILRNFISNAIRYTEKGKVSIICEASGGFIRIQVIDTGVGIPENEQEVIFDEFHQLNNVDRDRSKGLGLGLAIVQRTAKLLEHPIKVISQPGIGSTFTIEAKQSMIYARRLKPVPATAIEVDVTQTGRTLMVVIDDEKSIRDGTQSLFEQWDCDVIEAANKDDAIAQLRQMNRLPDGIICDYRLSDTQTGIEAIHAIFKAFNISIPAIIVSGDIAIESLRKVNNTQFQMLHKPVATLKLRTFLRHVQLYKTNNQS